ncbi:MAG: SusC/RagA family TonB-linked outer membrane protein [Bacteroidales bacterium]|nr:SusC/RagA family TonB-linked outer membrane protein [Bacteroidales bacterium]
MKHLFKIKFYLSIVFALSIFSENFAQMTVSGKITSAEDSEPLPGVNVVIKGTTSGAISDSEGNYSLNVPSQESVLMFSSVGFMSEEITVGNKSVIDISLTPELTALSEVVVVGYGTTLKKNVTTSISKVDPKGIPNGAISGANDLLFGKAAGVQVRQYSAQPGGTVELSIRGRGAPLIVVDGIIVPADALEAGINHSEINNVKRGNLGGVNPNDIESIEILKDASAAIYGVNAGNGVILITTKKGRIGKINVNYNANRSWQRNLPYLEPLQADEHMKLYNRFQEDRYLSENDMQPFGPNAPSGFVPRFSESDIANNTTNTDWVGLILRDGSIDNHNINISGGSENIRYYVSGGYFNQIGTVENSDMKKYTGSFDIAFDISKLFTLNAKVIGSRSNFNNSVAGWQTGGAGANGFTALQAALAYPTYLPIRDPNTGQYTQFQLIGNPVAQLDIKDQSLNNTLLVNTSLDINIIPNVLKGKIVYGNNLEGSFRDFFIPSTTNWFDDYRARASIQENKRQRQTFESFMTFNKEIADVVTINALAGYGEYIENRFDFGVQSFDMNDKINTTNIDGSPSNGFSNKDRNKQRSYIFRGSFDFLDRYLLSAAWRYDGFSQFFPESKYASFPSLSAGWKISNEPFLNIEAIDLLKLRASYGTTGRNLPSGVAYGIYTPEGQVISFNDGNSNYVAYVLSQIDHPDLTWEKTIMQNIGIDIELFNSRMSGSFELFRDDVTNLLRYGNRAANTEALSAIARQPVNGGHQVRTGLDAFVEADVIRNNNVTWNLQVNVSHYKYRWEERFKEDDKSTFLNVDDPVRAIYAFETKGILQLGEEAPEYQPVAAQVAGAPVFVDQNGDNVLDSADVLVYDQTPKISIGINSIFKYKNLDLGIFLYGQLGSYKQNYSLNWANASGMLISNQSGTQESYNAWSTENPGGELPGSTYDEALLGNIGNTIGWGSDYTISKADFLRVRNITLGYTIRSNQLKRYISDLRFYVDVQNAFIITKYKGADPEIESPGVKGAAAPYPMVRSYSLGLSVNF